MTMRKEVKVDLSLPSEWLMRALDQIYRVAWENLSRFAVTMAPDYISATLATWIEKHEITLASI